MKSVYLAVVQGTETKIKVVRTLIFYLSIDNEVYHVFSDEQASLKMYEKKDTEKKRTVVLFRSVPQSVIILRDIYTLRNGTEQHFVNVY